MKLNLADLKANEREFESAHISAAVKALNQANKKAAPITKRTLRREIGFNNSLLTKQKATRLRASKYKLRSSHGFKFVSVGLEEFNPRAIKKGVSVKIYGKRQKFPRAFIVPKSARAAGGLVMRRTGKGRYPIHRPAKIRLVITKGVWRALDPTIDNIRQDYHRAIKKGSA